MISWTSLKCLNIYIYIYIYKLCELCHNKYRHEINKSILCRTFDFATVCLRIVTSQVKHRPFVGGCVHCCCLGVWIPIVLMILITICAGFFNLKLPEIHRYRFILTPCAFNKTHVFYLLSSRYFRQISSQRAEREADTNPNRSEYTRKAVTNRKPPVFGHIHDSSRQNPTAQTGRPLR